jgi:hypothetical protein
VVNTGINPYEHLDVFILEQMHLYGLGGRGWSQIRRVVMAFLNRLWFDAVPDLSPATVERMLRSPREFLSLYGDDVPRKG